MSAKKKLEFNRKQKLLKRRQQKLASYYKNRSKKNAEYSYTNTKEATKKRAYRAKKAEKKEKENIRKRNYRQAMKSKQITQNTLDDRDIFKNVFNNRTTKHRAIKRLKNALPRTPKRRSATLAAYLQHTKSPAVEILRQAEVVSSPEDQMNMAIEKAALEDIKTAIDSCKTKRSKDSVTSMNVLVASISGEKVTETRCRKNLAKKLGLPVRRLSRGNRIRTTILKSEKSCWAYVCRKTRKDALSEETKRLAYNFWMKPGISRPTGNKADVKRERIGPKTYSSHQVYLLEKTQTEVYIDFTAEYPCIKLSQRSFENCKPYFIRQVRPKDRQTCCCRYHVETKRAFKSCMNFRKKLLNENDGYDENNVHVYDYISDIVDVTLCNKEDNVHKISCLKRNCGECGINKLELLPEETDDLDTAQIVKWERFEKVDIKVKGNKTIKKLVLVKKETKAVELFSHFLELLKSFPLHQHRATWQNKQYQTLLTDLPQNHCVCVHDFSENYRCTDLKELQSSYFQKTKVSIHVTIIHRHALLEYDGDGSTSEFPEIITEHFFVISSDQQHDQHFVHEVRKNITEYLKSISYPVHTMHEFTDGCAAQYKSRHCFGDISRTCKDFGYCNFTRNYFETAHAKGPQDSAGGLLKRQADIAVLRGRATIQNASDLYNFAVMNMTQTKSVCKRRLFRFVETIPRDTNLSYKPVSNIRLVHQVIVRDNRDEILIRELSCFSCDKCASHIYEECENISNTGSFSKVKMINETPRVVDNNEDTNPEIEREELSDLVSSGQVIAVYTDDPDKDYYLIKVMDCPHVLGVDTTDSWGSILPTGISVISGLYYDNNTSSPLSYKLVSKKKAIVPTESIVYICSEIDATRNIQLHEDIHLSILQCINELK